MIPTLLQYSRGRGPTTCVAPEMGPPLIKKGTPVQQIYLYLLSTIFGRRRVGNRNKNDFYSILWGETFIPQSTLWSEGDGGLFRPWLRRLRVSHDSSSSLSELSPRNFSTLESNRIDRFSPLLKHQLVLRSFREEITDFAEIRAPPERPKPLFCSPELWLFVRYVGLANREWGCYLGQTRARLGCPR